MKVANEWNVLLNEWINTPPFFSEFLFLSYKNFGPFSEMADVIFPWHKICDCCFIMISVKGKENMVIGVGFIENLLLFFCFF